MRAIIQRVNKASVSVNGIIKGQISSGVLIFLGIISDDNNEDISWLCNK
jgi:D-tyrosyl-tRNA(Tyr) deacylase